MGEGKGAQTSPSHHSHHRQHPESSALTGLSTFHARTRSMPTSTLGGGTVTVCIFRMGKPRHREGE